MRIGILTYHRALNYGAFLQAFALKRHLESEGHNVEIIDYWPDEHAISYSPFFINPNKHGLDRAKMWIYNTLRYRQYSKRITKMQRLWHDFFGLDSIPQYKRGADLMHVSYDCVIYGSDQIWWRHSPIATYSGFDPVFWGEYVPNKCKKIAYAASMGRMDINDEDKLFIRNSLQNFHAISVREKSLRQLLQPLTKTKIETVVDPTLLVGRRFWEHYANLPTPKNRYVLLYSLIPSSAAQCLARQKAKELGCNWIEITGAVRAMYVGKHYIQTADAFEFISYICNAEYVVTTSFHGTAFSILFEKQFCALGMGKNSSRVASLLQQLHIRHRLIDDNEELPTDYINYKQINEQLLHIVRPSIDYINKAITE